MAYIILLCILATPYAISVAFIRRATSRWMITKTAVGTMLAQAAGLLGPIGVPIALLAFFGMWGCVVWAHCDSKTIPIGRGFPLDELGAGAVDTKEEK